MGVTYRNGNPVVYDAASTIATFREPCPCCGGRLDVTRGSYDWVQRARIETECPACSWAGVWFASPAEPEPAVGIVVRKGAKQMSLFAGENR